MTLCNRREPEKEARRGKERERWTVRARLAAWMMDWLAGLPSWLAAAERTEMHRGTEQTQTCHFRRLIQSVMIFPHLALCSFSLFMAHHAPLDFGCSASFFFLLFFYQCAPPTDLCNSEKGWETKQNVFYMHWAMFKKGLNYVKQEYCP